MRPWRIVLTLLGLMMSLALASDTGVGLMAGERSGKGKRKPLILVINYPYQITGSARTLIHVTLFKPDFKPAAGAVVKVNGKEVGKADKNGTCIFDYVPGNSGSHRLTARLKKGGTTYRVTKDFASNARTASFKSDQLYVYTDRGVYNPGDDILIRLLAWELLADYTAIDKADVSLLLQNTQGRVFAGEKVKTNEYGVAAVKLPLAENMAEGDYELVVMYNKAREKARIRVKRFVPPIIEIRHNLKRFLTPAQDSLAVQADLAYFAGGKPKGAGLVLTARDKSGTKLLTKTFKETSDARFETTLNKSELDGLRKKLAAEQPFKMVLKATDKYDRMSEVTRDVVYTERPYRAVLEFDKDDYPPGETVKLQAKVVDLDGKPARGIKLVCEVAEFKVKKEAVTDDHGVAEFSFKMGKVHATAVVTSPVMPVPLAQKAVRLNSPKPMTSKVSEPPKKQGIQTHFDVTFDPRYRPVEKVIHVDFTDLSGGLVTSTTIPILKIDGDNYIAKGTVTASTWGTMLANLYVCAVEKKRVARDKRLSVKNVGFITEGQHVTLYPDSEATITIKGLKPRVKPGEKLDIKVEVKTRSGKEAALGAALVDNAVISLMDPMEVTPMDHFYNPQRKVISTGGAGVLTWPIVDRNWGSPWRDIAYSNWGFKSPGSMVETGGGPEGGPPMEGAASGFGGAGGGEYEKAEMKKPMSKSKKSMVLKSMDASVVDSIASVAGADKMDMDGGIELAEEESADEAGPGRSRNGRQAKKKARPKRITIRTKFPETAMWEPLLKTRGGKKNLSLTFPDAITVQRLTLVASDKEGSIGILHTDVEVRQDLFVQTDLPATMTLGDKVTVGALVQNLSGEDVEVVVQPLASGLDIVGPENKKITVKNGEAVPVEWTIKASFCGKVEFAVTADGESFKDEERKSIFVLPAGKPATTVEKGKLSKGKDFSADVKLDSKATYGTVFLNISFPNVIPAIQAWQAMNELPMAFVGVYGVASRAILDASMLEWGRENKMPVEWQDNLKGRLARAAAELTAAQNEDGSWGWFYLPDASTDRGGYIVSVYLSAYAVKALSAIAEVDLLPDVKAVAEGVLFLMNSRNKEGLWSADGAYFWEVNAPEVDWALSAELFDVVVRGQHAAGRAITKSMERLKRKMEKYLGQNPQEPGAVAHAVSGLLHWSHFERDDKLRKRLGSSIDYLLSLKRQGYWEPHWYHAYGGMVELNAQILELLREFGGNDYDAVIYELVTYLLSTREAWGAWHNEIGTANAVRALLAAGAGAKKEIASTVDVTVNGDLVASVSIDPNDPFLSAARLRYLELTPHLAKGKNKIEVTYNGNLTAPVMLETKQWGVKSRPARGDKPKGKLGINRMAPVEAELGQPVNITLAVDTDRKVPHVQILDAIPSNMEVDKASLVKLVKAGTIASFRIKGDSVAFFLAELKDELSFTYQLVATREGTSEHRGSKVLARYHKGFTPGRTVGETITVAQ